MHYVIGILLNGNNVEIIENDNPEKGTFTGLMVAMKRGEEMMKENPEIRQLNFYEVKQGQRILSQNMLREGHELTK